MNDVTLGEKPCDADSNRLDRAFWSVLTRADPDTRPYRDVLGSKYLYTSRVPNHKQIKRGDVFLVRDDDLVLGAGRVDEVCTRDIIIGTRACPACERAGISQRLSRVPTFRCNRCHHEFDEPLLREIEAIEYEADYGSTWEELMRPVSRHVVDSLLVANPGQNAIHRLDPMKTKMFLKGHVSLGFIENVVGPVPGSGVAVFEASGPFRLGPVSPPGSLPQLGSDGSPPDACGVGSPCSMARSNALAPFPRLPCHAAVAWLHG